jgi:hypothetical protein
LAENRRDECCGICAQDGCVGVGVFADERSSCAVPVGERQVDVCRIVHDMTVCHNEPVGGEYESRAGTAAAPGGLFYVNLHYGWAYVFDRLRHC